MIASAEPYDVGIAFVLLALFALARAWPWLFCFGAGLIDYAKRR